MAVRGTPSWLGDQNAALALGNLLEHGPQSRNGIGTLTGLSKQTAAQIVARLEERGLIHAVGEEAATRGPSATVYGVRNDTMYGVAVNIDQQGVQSVVVDVLGNSLPVARETAAGLDGERSAARDVASAVIRACRLAEIDLAAVKHVNIGVPSSVDPRSDELSSVEALPGWSRKSVRRQIEDALGCEVRVDNDVNLAAVAERRSGAFEQDAILALFWVGYGIGLALDIGGTVLHGASGGAGEIGHLPVARALLGAAGENTDLEDLIGAVALERLARELGENEFTFEGMLAGAALPVRVIEALAPRLALSVIPVLGVIDPDEVVLGGPVGRAGGAQLAELTRAAIRNHTRWDPSVNVSRIAEDAVLRGARSVLLTDLRESLVAQARSTDTAEDRSRIIESNLRGIH
ncbi:ROK family transcriptional regulator [Leifsonia sp. Root227]|uniref:ROK family transcriptional regulator n=1 Tax=Leifsonia sp. Root227 TaxID=1736496 RepID=UPI0006F73B3F|nr:ROK family transcriptional regulator [Leifsonia sp. Root227]KRC47082.1 ROK family transcriptional regulator [Leifsonia sp. Root227]